MPLLQLKNVKYSASLSRETNAFTASIYFAGAKIGEAENDGHGGCTMIHFADRHNIPITNEQARRAAIAFGMRDYLADSVYGNLETAVDGLLEHWIIAREVKKAQRVVCYTVKGKPVGTYARTRTKPNELTDDYRQWLMNRPTFGEFLHTMDALDAARALGLLKADQMLYAGGIKL